MTYSVLRLDVSARRSGSISRQLTDDVLDRLQPSTITTRDLATDPVPQIDEAWVNANFTQADARTPDQTKTLALSDQLVDEIVQADTLVIGLPIYNFGVPAALKAWIDQIARAGLTFRYTKDGPVGLLGDKRAIVVVASGGTKAGSEIDFATGYLRHVLGFVGITDVQLVTADRLAMDADATLEKAASQIQTLDRAA